MTEQINEGTSATDALDVAIGTTVAAALATDGPEKPVDLSALPPNCLNCGAPVRGRYCIDCGQVTDTHVPTLTEVVGDALALCPTSTRACGARSACCSSPPAA